MFTTEKTENWNLVCSSHIAKKYRSQNSNLGSLTSEIAHLTILHLPKIAYYNDSTATICLEGDTLTQEIQCGIEKIVYGRNH